MKKKILVLLLFIICSISSCIFLGDNSKKLLSESEIILNNLHDKIYINIYMEDDLSPNFKILQQKTKEILTQFKRASNKELDFDFVSTSKKMKEQVDGTYNPFSSQGINPLWVKNQENYHKIFPYAVVNFREKALPVLLHNSLFYDTISELTEEELNKSINQLEYNFIESLYLIQQTEKKKIAFLTGNGQLDSINTRDIRNTLSKFYDIDFFDLRSFEIDAKTNKPDIWKQIERLKKYECIVIAKPTKTFFEMDKFLIDQYIMNGGKTLWLVDGTTANMNQFNRNLEFEIFENKIGIDKLLSNYGVKINKDLILDERCAKSPVYIKNEIAYLRWQYKPILSTNPCHIIGELRDTLLTDFVSSITITQENKSTILLSSSEKSNIKKCGEKVSFDIIKQIPNTFSGKKPTAVLLEGDFNSNYSEIIHEKLKLRINNNKMIIVSDGDIIANLHNPPNFYYPLGYYHYGRNIFDGNTNFILNSIQYLCDDEILIKLLNQTKLNEKR